jgi:hypothetical protein
MVMSTPAETIAEDAPGPLGPLVEVVCEVEDRHGMTPVLVCDRRLVLADEFYIDLCQAVAARCGRMVRLDLLPGHPLGCRGLRTSLLGPLASAQLWQSPWLPPALASAIFFPMRKQFLKRLARRLPQRSRIESTAAVSRPGGPLRELVIGLAGPSDELPPFAQEIALGIEPAAEPA